MWTENYSSSSIFQRTSYRINQYTLAGVIKLLSILTVNRDCIEEWFWFLHAYIYAATLKIQYKIMLLTLKWLKANCQMVHYFGLGFIQLKINQYERLHFYTKDLPPIVPEEDIHNHRYDFTSKILAGMLIQEVYEVIPGSTHLIEDESCQVDVKTQIEEMKPCSIRLSSKHTYNTYSEYFIGHETFHRVYNFGYCITHLTRTDYKKKFAQVIRPVGQEKVCPFSHKVAEGDLWDIIGAMIGEYNVHDVG